MEPDGPIEAGRRVGQDREVAGDLDRRAGDGGRARVYDPDEDFTSGPQYNPGRFLGLRLGQVEIIPEESETIADGRAGEQRRAVDLLASERDRERTVRR